MVFIPFKSELSEALQNTRSLALKIVICAGVTAFIVFVGIAQFVVENVRKEEWLDIPWTACSLAIGGALLTGGVLGLVLELKDVVEKRRDANQKVSIILRAYFASGGWSLALWFITLLLLSMVGVSIAAPFWT